MTSRTPEGTALPDSEGHLRRVRIRLMLSLSFLFVVAMILAGPAAGTLDLSRGTPLLAIVRLVLVALALPVIMTILARGVTRPTADLVASHDRLQRLYDQARLDALIDPISGLGNHRAFQEEMTRQIEVSTRQAQPLALILIDLDDLKRINDEDGHAGGDQILGDMGKLIAGISRASDRGFRIGGDEFAWLLPGATAQAASAVAQRLLGAALNAEIARPGARSFSFSAGLSSYPGAAGDSQQLFRQADAALYWAKQHGRTDVQAFDPERHVTEDPRATPELAEAVLEVATRSAVTPVYQTIFDLRSGQPVGFEGLVRPTQESGFRDAHSLFVAAEAAQRTVELDLVCVEAVVAGAAMPDEASYLAFNMSPRTLETEQFRVADLLAVFQPHGISPHRVVLEITEREAIEDMERLRKNLDLCRAAGMRIAADDVGAGNAGLRLLSEIRFDIVKVDLSLVQRGALRDSALAVLRAIRDIGQESGAMVVAEGIETGDQLEVVQMLKLVAGQGYLLATPAPEIRAEAIDLDALMAEHEHRRRAFGGFLDIRSADDWLVPVDDGTVATTRRPEDRHPPVDAPAPSGPTKRPSSRSRKAPAGTAPRRPRQSARPKSEEATPNP